MYLSKICTDCVKKGGHTDLVNRCQDCDGLFDIEETACPECNGTGMDRVCDDVCEMCDGDGILDV